MGVFASRAFFSQSIQPIPQQGASETEALSTNDIPEERREKEGAGEEGKQNKEKEKRGEEERGDQKEKEKEKKGKKKEKKKKKKRLWKGQVTIGVILSQRRLLM